MKLAKTLVMSGLLMSGFVNAAQTAEDAKPCVQYALAAWLVDGQSPYQAFTRCTSASVVSDPHITTFKGLAYDHNFPGDYTLMELQDGSGFSMVGRFIFDKANKVSSYTIPKSVKFEWSGHTLEIHRGDEGAVILIDGKASQLKNNKSVQIGDVGYISRKGAAYFIANTVSDVATVVNANGFYLDLNVTVPKETDTRGLLGQPLSLSLFDRLGAELPALPDANDSGLNKVSRADFGGFLESWRLTGNVFATGDLPEPPDYDTKIYTLADLGKNRMDTAELQCEVLEAEFPERFNRRNCLFDIGFGGKKFAKSAHRDQPSTLRMEVLN